MMPDLGVNADAHRRSFATLGLLVSRLVAKHDTDAWDYHSDITEVLSWLTSVAEKEARYCVYGYELADRQSGGGRRARPCRRSLLTAGTLTHPKA